MHNILRRLGIWIVLHLAIFPINKKQENAQFMEMDGSQILWWDCRSVFVKELKKESCVSAYGLKTIRTIIRHF